MRKWTKSEIAILKKYWVDKGSCLLNSNFEIIGVLVGAPDPGGGVSCCETVDSYQEYFEMKKPKRRK